MLQSCYQLTTNLLPAHYRLTTSLLPACYQLTINPLTNPLPTHYKLTTNLLPACYKRATKILQSLQSLQALWPSTRSSTKSLLKCYEQVLLLTTNSLQTYYKLATNILQSLQALWPSTRSSTKSLKWTSFTTHYQLTTNWLQKSYRPLQTSTALPGFGCATQSLLMAYWRPWGGCHIFTQKWGGLDGLTRRKSIPLQHGFIQGFTNLIWRPGDWNVDMPPCWNQVPAKWRWGGNNSGGLNYCTLYTIKS